MEKEEVLTGDQVIGVSKVQGMATGVEKASGVV